MDAQRKYFGTDGIRGLANRILTPELALKVGMAAGRIFVRGEHRHRVVIGKDTRLSGYMIESALVAGFTAVGMDVFLFGPLPTAAIAMLTPSMRADLGVMISASHNPYEDNGIKLFGPDGRKLPDSTEREIEHFMENNLSAGLASSRRIGRARRIDDSQARYIEHAKRTFPKELRLDGRRIVLDCANGAAYRVAPTILWELGAEVIEIGIEPNGFNINAGYGSTAPEAMQQKVRDVRADFGIALDGDADRAVMCDENGQLIDGDQVIAIIAKRWVEEKRLKGSVVGTVLSNYGLEHYIKSLDIPFTRSPVGDRYVLEKMEEQGSNIGGEQSGHVILTDFNISGDGIVAALQVLAALQAWECRASSCRLFTPVPQTSKNVRRPRSVLLEASVKDVIGEVEASLKDKGRLVVRPSGTEPVIRIMAEAEDEALARTAVEQIERALESAAG